MVYPLDPLHPLDLLDPLDLLEPLKPLSPHTRDPQQSCKQRRIQVHLAQAIYPILLGVRGSFAQGLPQELPLFGLDDQVIDRPGVEQVLAGGIEKSDAAPGLRRNRLRKLEKRTDLDLIILFLRPGMVALFMEQFGPGGQLVAADGRSVLDGPLLLAKGSSLVKSQVVDSNDFGRSPQRNAIPTQKPRDFKIARPGHHRH